MNRKSIFQRKINYLMDGQREDKAGTNFDTEAEIEVRGNTLKYVSRGGLKLEKAMKEFDISLEGMVCMDIGASTGGFTDCMLQNGAVKVYSVDVGYWFSPYRQPLGHFLISRQTSSDLQEQIPSLLSLTSVHHG